MRKDIFLKVLQRHTYTCLSHRYGIYFAFAGIVIVMYSMFQFGEELLEWSQSQYDSLFSLYHDNIAANSFQAMISAPIPIDVVYTWVNGSDPVLLSQLNSLKQSLNMNNPDNATVTTNSPAIQDVQCQLKYCFQLPCLIATPSFGKLKLSEAKEKYKDQLSNLKWIKEVEVAKGFLSEAKHNVSLLRFENKDKATEALTKIRSSNTSNVQFAYVTSDEEAPYSTPLPHGLLLSDVPDKMNSEDLREKFPTSLKGITDWIHVVSDKHLALVWTTDVEMTHKMLHAKDNSSIRSFSIDSKIVSVTPAFMVMTIEEQTQDDMARSRFEDNDELRFSLRSIEKYAPWVRKIFIVTNGQIPYWLNLDNPRISVVTHEEIFTNKSHLPTFSSPSIETHIHKIPGLAKKFIYMNDDVMFGKEVWPDDFYTHSFGQKVYLTWPVPNCAEGCAPSWIKDGYCDSACNISECNWDGGDCTGSNVKAGVGSHFGGSYGYSQASYCQPGCANSWLADKFCDQSCNKVECGFDAGDCGIKNYDKVYKIPFTLTNDTNYIIPDGLKNGYIDISEFYKKITSAEYDLNNVIRTAAVSNKYRVVTVVYNGIANKTNSRFQLSGEIIREGEPENDNAEKAYVTVTFNITAFPSKNSTVNVTQLRNQVKKDKPKKKKEKEPVLKSIKTTVTPEYMDIIGVAEDMKKPRLPTSNKITDQDILLPSEINETVLPANVRENLKALDDEFEEEILTRAGYQKKRRALLLPYVSLLEGILPMKKRSDDSLSLRKDGEVGNDLGQTGNARKPLKDHVKKSVDKIVEHDFSEKSHEHIKGDLGLIKGVDNTDIKEEQRKRSTFKDSQLKNPFYRMVKTQMEKEKLQLSDSEIEKPEVFSKRKLLGLQIHDEGADDHLNRILHNQPSRGIQNQGFLPWEKKLVFDEAVAKREKINNRKTIMKLYEVDTPKLRTGRRKPLDTFADSLRFVSHLYNRDFGFMQRKVPAHMPHFIDVDIMNELQAMYPHEYDITSSHKLRHSKDMQFAFSYNYFIMSVKESLDMKEIFKSLDTDGSEVLSDREIRVLATKTHDLPLTLNELTRIEKNLISCAWKLYGPQKSEEGNNTEVEVGNREDLLQSTDRLPAWAITENYYDKDLPLVTEHLVLNCPYVVNLINKTYGGENKYKYQVMEQEEIAFKMIRTNVSTVVGQLDDIRKNPKKFICLNDNIEHHKTKEAEMIKAVLRDFYETLFPKESQFELDPEYRNRFLHMKSLREWRDHRDYVSAWLRIILFILMLMTFFSMTWDRIHPVFRRNRHRLSRRYSKFKNVFWKLLEKHKTRGKTNSV